MENEKQKDEIIALESIYTKEEFSYYEENNQYHCNMKIFINLPADYYFTYKDTRNAEEPEEMVVISHLPPLLLCISLPEDYPSKSPPNFTLSSSWLHQTALIKLCKKLDELWEENDGQEILFLWMAFLQDETLQILNIQENLRMDYAYTRYKMNLEKVQSTSKGKMEKQNNVENVKCDDQNMSNKDVQSFTNKRILRKKYKNIDKRAKVDHLNGRNPIQVLVNYNEERNQIEFQKNFYTCKICFCDKSGQNCTKFLPCQHVFCKECIAGYLEVKIKEGSVQNICCPEEKCTSEATPGQVKDLVNAEMFAKYDSLLLAATLDTMSDIVYCPRRTCQYPVSREPDEQMASCPACQYAFCVYCKMLYHGIEPCKANSVNKQQLVNEYQTASSERKLELEQRYGKKQLQLLVENTMSEHWISSNSQHCPQCKASIEKSDGCNKMTCWKCKTYFCWLCGTRLNQDKPYLHFQTLDSKCYKMLYHGVISDDEEDDDPDLFMLYDYADDDDDVDNLLDQLNILIV